MTLDIVNRFTFTDTATVNLNGAHGATSAAVGGTTYLFVTGYDDSGVSVFAVGADGTLTNTANVADQPGARLAGATSVATAEVGGTTYLFVAGFLDDGISTFAVGNDGSLTSVGTLADFSLWNLDGPVSVRTAVVGGTSYLFVASDVDEGISVFAIDAGGGLTNVHNTQLLSGVSSIATAEAAGASFLFVADIDNAAVRAFAVSDAGALIFAAGFTSSSLEQVSSVATASVGGTTYIFAGSEGGIAAGLSVLRLNADDTLSEVMHLALDGTPRDLAVEVIDGTSYLFVPSTGGQVRIFSVGDGGFLSPAGTINDDAALAIDGTWGVTTATVAGRTFLFATGSIDDGVSAFELSAAPPSGPIAGSDANDTLAGDGTDNLIVGLGGNDKLTGGGGSDTLLGGDGRDTLNGSGGNDILIGGAGNDTYTVDSAGDVVTELANEGTDTVRTLVDYMLGANVERLKLIGSADIDGAGNALDNVITGNSGSNVIRGGEGRDVLFGKAGDDTFVFASAAETGVGSARDIIRDFNDFGDNDTIDLSGFAGTLTFSNAATFSGVLNEVIAVQSGADVLIRINTATGAAAEAEIRLIDTLRSQINASDFDLV